MAAGRSGWCSLGAGGFLTVDLLFFAANLTKLTHGAWLPLLIAVIVFTVLTTWQRGRALVTARRKREEGTLRAFVDELHRRQPAVERVPGTAVFLNRDKSTVPLAMRANVKHNHILHEHCVILSIETMPVPHVAGRRAADDRRSRIHRRRHHLRRRAIRLHGRRQRPAGAARSPPRPDWSARSRSKRRPTSSPRSTSTSAAGRACGGGASGCSSPPRGSPPMPRSTSGCPATGRSSWARGSRCSAPVADL